MKNLDEDYRQAGFGGRLGFGAKPALILVDFVAAYFDEASPLFGADIRPRMVAALESALRLRKAAHRAHIPVVLTRIELTEAELAANLLARKTGGMRIFAKGNPLADFAPGLTPLPDDIVLFKHYPSGFFATPLSSILAARGVDSLIIAGLSTSGCVRATCTDSLCHGYIPLVVRDAVADRDDRPHAANLFDMGSKYADIIGETEALAYLERVANA